MKTKAPYFFDEFFASGLEESVSPFLTKNSRDWGKNLSLKSSLVSAFFYLLAFAFSFVRIEISYFCITFVYFLSGMPAIDQAITDLRNLQININLLMILAAFISLAIGSYLEGAFLLVLFHLSGALEKNILQKAINTLQLLHKVTPKKALIYEEKKPLYEKALEEITPGMLLLVRPGEIVPLDSKVIEGSSYLNLSHLTGESKPIAIAPGHEAPAGAQNGTGRIIIEVLRTSSDSTLTKLIQLITKAQKAKPQLQRWLETFGSRYAKSILALTFALIFLLPWIFSIPFDGKEGAIYRALAFLIAASPCALLIGPPIAYMAAISSCAKNGIILKGGLTLDALNNCKKIALDKTGTLTSGKMELEQIVSLSNEANLTNNKALSLIASLEQNATHPLAEAIFIQAKAKKLPFLKAEEISLAPGHGINGKIIDNKTSTDVAIGSLTYLKEHFSLPEDLYNKARKEKIAFSKLGKNSAFALIGKKTLFCFVFSDQIRPETKSVIKQLKEKFHLTVMILSGDQTSIANRVGKEIGVDEVYGNLTPEDKLSLISQASKKVGIAMVGDGMNDAPSLARSTVGIAMGKVGSQSAIYSSDIVLLRDDLNALGYLFAKAHKTARIIRQNLFFALAVICLASIPAMLGFLPLWLAILLHEGGTLLVALNGLRLLRNQ